MEQFLQLLLDRLNQVPQLLESRLFNNQLKKMAETDQFLFPAALLEVFNVVYTPLTGDVQAVTCTVRVHVVNESPLQGYEMDIYTLKDQVNQYLFKHTGGGFFEELVRTRENLDLNHENLYDYQIEYTTRFLDKTSPLDEQTVILEEIDANYDLDVDSETIRTGDNQGYQFTGANLDHLQ